MKQSYLKCFKNEVFLHVTFRNDKLYSIGGYNNIDGFLSTVEILYVGDRMNNIENEMWIFIDNLLEPMRWSRSIIHGDNLYVIGGHSDLVNNINEIAIIDTYKDKVRLRWISGLCSVIFNSNYSQ